MLTHDVILQIKSAMAKAGLNCPAPIVADDKFHRFGMSGDKGKPCSYIVHIFDNDLVYVYFNCFKRGISGSFCSRSAKELSSYDQELIKQKQKLWENELREKNAQAKKGVQYIWERAEANFTEHPYLNHKQVKSFRLRLYKGLLLLPLYNENGELCSLQFINANGDKWFKKDSSVKACFFIIGEVSEKIYIAEGYATAATIHEVTGDAVVVALNANNLLPVAQIIRKQNLEKTLKKP